MEASQQPAAPAPHLCQVSFREPSLGLAPLRSRPDRGPGLGGSAGTLEGDEETCLHASTMFAQRQGQKGGRRTSQHPLAAS